MMETSEWAAYCFGVLVRCFNPLALATRAYLRLAAVFVEVSE